MGTVPMEHGTAATPYRATIQDIVNQPEKDWSPVFLKSQIASAEERLHLQGIWLKIGRAWAILGNIALWTITVLADILQWHRAAPIVPILYGAAIVSTLASPVVMYQQYKRLRSNRLGIKKTILILREKQTQQDGYTEEAGKGTLVRQRRYRDDMPDIIAQMREQAGRLRSTHNRYQTVIIVGSILASAITTASVSFDVTRWIAVAVTAAVGLSAGFTGYYKFHENSYNLQQTADSIEREYEAVELRVGRYAKLDHADAYSLFAETVERLRDEQNKRQQQLDQPVETKREDTPTTTA
ncbi:hypothetical protein GCM10022225_18540 [Plantactinospora mayteni]|uniref:DUF4231 domain-containing protein n=1 Tax=Plantactinospora mayteni TaxID=566021 RepID=A0ABQ4EN25_9ACTN|nr:DUF4231 domain-containing protein [Plantactinospora mayteni]GIG96039.1 hypothetical protein Pma05_26120 [Plantactinospora mayteni]